MFGEKAVELVKELQRSKNSVISPYNDDVLRQVFEEMKVLYEQNHDDVNDAVQGSENAIATIQVRHAALERNKRCVLAYLYNRLERIKQLRWDFGSVLTPDVKYQLSESEVQWFNNYNKCLAGYMRSLGSQGGLDLTQDVKPPRTLYVEVRCLVDHGEFVTSEGNKLLFNKNSQHYILRSDCESLIRQGILEHIVH